MNTTISVRVNQQLKKTFLTKTKERGLDGSVLIRYFMEKYNSNPDIVKFDIVENAFDDIFKNEEVKSKLKKISNKLDKLGF
ncbi:hypothetical protein EOM39_06020 [Candidatus Gracilibacteria bacterium]|nr:hypothetical protein [Candidatus Gracilibacteria bacterium]